MVSRLRKAINSQRHYAYEAAKRQEKVNRDAKERTLTFHGKLPYPKKLFNQQQQQQGRIFSCSPIVGSNIVKSSTEKTYSRMMQEHGLWVRVFNNHDRLLLNHTDSQMMHTSQMIQLCTQLVSRLNLLSRTDELEVQEALGTLEEMLIAQLTPPLDGSAQYHSWNLQGSTGKHESAAIGAIAIIKQNADRTFSGQLFDDYIGTTFQL